MLTGTKVGLPDIENYYKVMVIKIVGNGIK